MDSSEITLAPAASVLLGSTVLSGGGGGKNPTKQTAQEPQGRGSQASLKPFINIY